MNFQFEDPEIAEKFFFEGRIINRFYVSKQFKDSYTQQKKRFAYKIHNCDKLYQFMKQKDQVILSETKGRGGRYQLKALICEEEDKIENLVVQTFTENTGKLEKPVKLTTLGRFKLTTSGRSKLTTSERIKLTTPGRPKLTT